MTRTTELHDWALVLAGGQGRRMAHLTVTETGMSVPKQFCSVGRGSSLVHVALRRAGTVAPPERVLASVTAAHESWWRNLGDCMPPANLVVQPEQRGTAIGILHPLLEILRRDPDASVAILPSDHYFGDEAAIAEGLRTAMKLTRKFPDAVLLLGFEPEELDADLGYILPAGLQHENPCAVSRFVEKPVPAAMRALVAQGALCNSFILAANARALLELFERRCPDVVTRLRAFVGASLDPAERRNELAKLFHDLPSVDFSKEVLAVGNGQLRVLRLPSCGWSDLGTPVRLHRLLQRHRTAIERAPAAPDTTRGHVDLAERSTAAISGLLPTTGRRGAGDTASPYSTTPDGR